ncbi:MAG: T9SS type A sorting domain-containing protein [Bacteroidales bacterium]|nr:T9SS type A sorting domain-containing protein [Bacteroidales bacterium]
MKNTKFTLAFLMGLIFMVGGLYAQKQNFPSKPKDNQTQTVDTRIDNMKYWKEMAAKGLVSVEPEKEIPAAIFTGSKITAKSVVAKEDSPDVPLTNPDSYTESENSIFVSPENSELVLNSNNSTSIPASNLYGANYFISEDAGLNWGGSAQGAGGNNSGDPATAISLDGRMYVGFIHSNYGQGVAHSTDGGVNWTSVVCGTPPGGWNILDKNHMWIDNSPSSAYEGNVYSAWTGFGNANDSEIEFVRSTNGGLNWTAHMNISSAVNAGSHNQGVNLQTGPNGEVYAVWAIYDSWPSDESALGFAKSTDGGATFSTATRIISNIRGIRTSETSKNHRVNSFPVMAVDISGGQYNGYIYITWANIGVPGVNTGSDIDVYMIKSTNGGSNWSTPIRINQDPSGQGKEHYFPWITCDPENGILSAIFYDDRNVNSNQCEVYCANSFDAGETWEDFKVSDVAFTPTAIPGLAGGYMGDYLGISARGSYVYPVWTDTRDGFMTWTSPYVTNNLPRPENLSILLDEETGAITLNWEFNGEGFLHFNVYRDGQLLGETNDLTYSDNLPDYGVFGFQVTAMHDEGESTPASGSIQWGNPHIAVSQEAINVNLVIGTSTVDTMYIENVGELELSYDITPEITSKGPKDYCSASGGCDEFISRVIFGDIDNVSGCDGYADYTDQSTLLNMGESYDITIENGNYYSSDDLGIWIDWNHDGDFEDSGENVYCGVDMGGEGTFGIVVPTSAIPGQTTMRIRMKWSGSDCGSPCGTTTYGEVEDYSVYVLGWLLVNPTEGTIQAGENDEIFVTLDAADLEEGVYTANLNISNTDPDLPMVIVPVTLTVGESIPTLAVWADPADVCFGESTQLNANVTGGSGNYTYSWTSDPEGFTSSEASPIVIPEDTTTYFVEVFDGTFTVSDFVVVNVAPMPGICSTPEGPTEFCEDPENSVYSTEGAEYALSYVWYLIPEEAGTISGEGTEGIVNWNMEFTGEATISVKAMNDCGEGEMSEILTVTIHANPDVLLDLEYDSVCIYTPMFEITGGTPAGGIYSGTGVIEDNGIYYFDPNMAGIGEHTITYDYIDEFGCANSAEDMIYVGECTGINEIVDGRQIEIFPNPNKGNFTIKISAEAGESASFRIMNNLGVQVFEEQNIELHESFATDIDLNTYSEGLYFVYLTIGNNDYIRKIVVRK